MKALFVFALLTLLATPAFADDEAGANSDVDQGLGLLDQGARLLLQGLMSQMKPQLDDLGAAIGDLSAYGAPRILPNGDILIPRKVPLKPKPRAGDDIDL